MRFKLGDTLRYGNSTIAEFTFVAQCVSVKTFCIVLCTKSDKIKDSHEFRKGTKYFLGQNTLTLLRSQNNHPLTKIFK